MNFTPEIQPAIQKPSQETLTANGNIIQIMLAEKQGESIDDFIDKHATKFRQVADENPNWLIEFSTNPDAILKQFESKVFH